jgi:hypothetical protein
MLAKQLAVGAVLALSSAACATRYGPQSWRNAGGYSEHELSPTEWVLTFRGNSGTDATRVYEFWQRRAAELAASKSCASYDVLDLHSEPAKQSLMDGTSYTDSGPSMSGRIRCKLAPAGTS